MYLHARRPWFRRDVIARFQQCDRPIASCALACRAANYAMVTAFTKVNLPSPPQVTLSVEITSD
jgi:hypothetical protein